MLIIKEKSKDFRVKYFSAAKQKRIVLWAPGEHAKLKSVCTCDVVSK
jgi:hypothetical protein